MAAVSAFLGMLAISIVVALLALLQLGDYFNASDEFPFLLALTAVFTLLSLGIFTIAYATAAHARILAGVSPCGISQLPRVSAYGVS